MRRSIAVTIRKYPRSTAAAAFGLPAAAIVHFAWIPDARFVGIAPALSIAAGVAHAFAAIITGPRLVKPGSNAVLLGIATSLLALFFFSAGFSSYVWIGEHLRSSSAFGYAVFAGYVGLFALLAGGWAAVLASMAIGWSLKRMALGRAES